MFIGHLAQQGLSYASIKVYMPAVCNLHVSEGLHEEFAKHLTPRLELVLKGIKKESAPRRLRLPITLDVMEKIKRVLLQHPKDPENVMMWAACCTTFFGFLRCGEFTIPSLATYDPEVHLSLAMLQWMTN